MKSFKLFVSYKYPPELFWRISIGPFGQFADSISVLEKAAVMIDDKDLDKDSKNNSKNIDDLQQLSIDELEKLIQKALKKEEYELAVKIRDEIAKRGSKH